MQFVSGVTLFFLPYSFVPISLLHGENRITKSAKCVSLKTAKAASCVFQMEQLYIEVLYTIANTVGASTGQYAHYKEDLYRYAQEAFGVPQDQHRRYLNIASEEKVFRQLIDFLPEGAEHHRRKMRHPVGGGAAGRYRRRGENKRHVTYLSLLQPPIVVLSVVVIEADGLEAKDVNGERIPFRFVALRSRRRRA